ncbi:MAG: hypothetical protein SAK29_14750 [Scytonema sp. PMC 1069.18]|nr:hypothetical protein [Scytonema sp. PMC 1069.18]MEC4886871.1 hypothetical protein [Scytonema sp. PMC 1070.18]
MFKPPYPYAFTWLCQAYVMGDRTCLEEQISRTRCAQVIPYSVKAVAPVFNGKTPAIKPGGKMRV